MEFSLEVDKLSPEITNLMNVTEQKAGIPALSSILIESIPKGIKLTGTDLESSLQVKLNADVKTEGSMCVPAGKLSAIVKSLGKGTIKFKKDASSWVTITCNKSKFRVAGIPVEHYPAIPSLTSEPLILDEDVFKKLVQYTCFATTVEESRYTLNGALLEINGDCISLTATDGHRIAHSSHTLPEAVEEPWRLLIPKRSVGELAKIVKKYVGISYDDNHIKFESGSRVLISRRITGEFPEYQKAIPENYETSVSFNNETIVNALKRVALMSDEFHHAVKFNITKNKALLSCASDGESEETLECVTKNIEQAIVITLNSKYLIDFFAVGEKSTMYIKDSLSQAKIVDGKAIYICMPIRSV